MLIRIFTSNNMGYEKYVNAVWQEQKTSEKWDLEICDPVRWAPGSVVADVHIHIDQPLRVAVPWASYNVFASDFALDTWVWTKTEMDLTVSYTELTEKETAVNTFRRIFGAARHPPALPLPVEDGVVLPKVGIITLTRNRKSWWRNMVQNVGKQNWSPNRMEWIIVDDGDVGQRLHSEAEAFRARSGLTIRYVELDSPVSIGEKRNMGVRAASPDVTVFVNMDDDDHYPSNSILNRVAWLNRALPAGRPQSQIGYCSIVPMYDLTRYISAMNVPELDIGPAERVSEATLIFTRDAWVTRPFPDSNMAEGLEFVEGREEISVEMPPAGIIVSFIHTKNTSSRRIPKEEEPNGCHYGFSDEYFQYIHTTGMATS